MVEIEADEGSRVCHYTLSICQICLIGAVIKPLNPLYNVEKRTSRIDLIHVGRHNGLMISEDRRDGIDHESRNQPDVCSWNIRRRPRPGYRRSSRDKSGDSPSASVRPRKPEVVVRSAPGSGVNPRSRAQRFYERDGSSPGFEIPGTAPWRPSMSVPSRRTY